MKRGVRIWEKPLENFDGVFGSNLAALGFRCWALGMLRIHFLFLRLGLDIFFGS
jgi:hypothetical protein